MKVVPIQPIVHDQDGKPRFRRNKIVETLLDSGKLDMNALVQMDFSPEDSQQFAQLIGYSLHGYRELPYVDDDAYEVAERLATATSEYNRRVESINDDAGELAMQYHYARAMMDIASERVRAFYNTRINDALEARNFDLAERLLRQIPCPVTATFAADRMRQAGWKLKTK